MCRNICGEPLGSLTALAGVGGDPGRIVFALMNREACCQLLFTTLKSLKGTRGTKEFNYSSHSAALLCKITENHRQIQEMGRGAGLEDVLGWSVVCTLCECVWICAICISNLCRHVHMCEVFGLCMVCECVCINTRVNIAFSVITLLGIRLMLL